MRYPLRHKSAVDEDMLGAGFEPAHPEITELKSAALDQLGHPSATSLAGLEPAIFHLGGGRIVHYATETS